MLKISSQEIPDFFLFPLCYFIIIVKIRFYRFKSSGKSIIWSSNQIHQMRITNITSLLGKYSGFVWMIPFLLLLIISPELLKAQNESEFSEYTVTIPDSDQSIEMVPVPGGTFEMGPINGSTHDITVDPFWMGKYEITWNEYNLFRNEVIEDIRTQIYKELYGVDIESDALSSPTLSEEALDLLRDNDVPADIISLPSPPYMDMSFGMGTDDFPAAGMTQYAAYMFTKWLTVKTGEFYRLPTEAEWEYACRAANSDEYEMITDESELGQYAWYQGNSDRKYHEPGQKQPNALGIHDMLGNVAEWTFDQYHEDYVSQLEGEPADNPFFKPTELYPRAVRGGSWSDEAEATNCLERRASTSQWKMRDPQLPKSMWWLTNASFLGFRVVKPVNQPETVDEMEEYWIEAMPDYF